MLFEFAVHIFGFHILFCLGRRWAGSLKSIDETWPALVVLTALRISIGTSLKSYANVYLSLVF